jgi:glycosyltransferase involved in cell wall biosynthesis
MRILHISEHYAPVGGAETYLLGVLDELDRRGHENVVLYRREHPRTVQTERAAHCVPRDDNVGARGAGVRRIRELIFDESPDVIYLHLVYDPTVIELAASLRPTAAYMHNMHPCCPGLAKYFRRTHSICHYAYDPFRCALNVYLRRCASARHPRSVYRILRRTELQQEAYGQVDALLVASSFMSALFVQNGLGAQAGCEIIPYFVNVPDRPEQARTEDQAPPMILYVGRLEAEKGVPYLLRAVAQVQCPSQLVLAGDGTRRAECEALAHHLRIDERVSFVGWLTRQELAEFYAKSTLLAFPSIWPEPFGLTGPEAMSFGTPVVASAVGGVSDWLQDGKNGLLVEPRNERQLAEKMEALLQDWSLAHTMGEAGRRRVAREYSVDLHMDRLLRVLDGIT